MAYDEGHAQLFRDVLAAEPGLTERKMFGGICFMLDGNMLCGVHKGGAMFRVGKSRMEAALAIPGAGPMAFTGRPMGGLIDVDEDALADSDRFDQWMALAFENARSLPPK